MFTNGCFDVLHVGHMRLLKRAKKFGVLIVGLNTDASVRRLKGPSRPLIGERERLEVIAALGAVDYVTLFGEHTPEKVVYLIKPDVHVKGGDYTIDRLPEAKIVKRYGGKVVIAPLVKRKSTTALIEKIRKMDNHVGKRTSSGITTRLLGRPKS